MNALDHKIYELFIDVADRKGWAGAEAIQKYDGLRTAVERGHNSRSTMISVLKIALEA